jgi:hypothetical protein
VEQQTIPTDIDRKQVRVGDLVAFMGVIVHAGSLYAIRRRGKVVETHLEGFPPNVVTILWQAEHQFAIKPYDASEWRVIRHEGLS